MQSVLKILFIDDHSGLQKGLGTFLSQRKPDFYFVYASSSTEGIEKLKENPDIGLVLLDINLDGENGLLLASQLRKIQPEIKIIVYTMYFDVLHIEQALRSNIQGYITKDSEIEELEKAILAVADGNMFFNKRANSVMQAILQNKALEETESNYSMINLVENYKKLSQKEQIVFKQLALNKTTKQVADFLGKSEKTIINQKSIIYGKLGVHDKHDLIEAAKFLGVIA